MALTKLSRGVLYAVYFLVVAALAILIAVSFHSGPKKTNPPTVHHSVAKSNQGSSNLNQAPNPGPNHSGSSQAAGSTANQSSQLSNSGPGDVALVGFMVAVPVGFYIHRRFKLSKI